MTLTILYFAWLRERIGEPRETVQTGAGTVAELVEELREDVFVHAGIAGGHAGTPQIGS